jgi:hypothetical protein
MVLTAAFALAACGGSSTVTPDAGDRTGAPGSTPTGEVATPEPSGPPSEPPASEEPEPEPTDAETAEPVTPEPETPEPAGSASACTGTDDNRAFYADLAPRVAWALYCPVLPRGWSVVSGQYRLADGGRLEITYRGPEGAGLMLQEGSFCPGDADCTPEGEDRGATAFGDREGTLIATGDGWAVVVDRGERPSWLLTVSGVGEDAARTFAADLALVGG